MINCIKQYTRKMQEEIEDEVIIEDEKYDCVEYTTIQSYLSEIGNYCGIQQIINKGYFNSLFLKIENGEQDILVDFFVNAYYILLKYNDAEAFVIDNKTKVKNMAHYSLNYNILFYDKDIDLVLAYDFDKKSKSDYINIVNASIVKIARLSPLFDHKFNIDRVNFLNTIMNLIIYKPEQCGKIIRKYKLKKTKRHYFKIYSIKINKKKIIKDQF